jgi:flagellar motor switch/type III secretory pathway protein FliN
MSAKRSTKNQPDTSSVNERTSELSMNVSIVLGRTRAPISLLLNLAEGSLLELQKKSKTADQVEVQGLSFLERTGGKRGVGGRYPIVDVRVNGKSFAEGEVVTIGEAFGVRLTEILNRDLE